MEDNKADKRAKQHMYQNENEDDHPDWLRLPSSLVSKISEKLSLCDYLSFTFVCILWTSYLLEAVHYHPSSGFPWLATVKEPQSGTMSCMSLLENNKILQLELPISTGGFMWGSIKDWLIIVKPLVKMFNTISVSLFNPFMGHEVRLPNTNFGDFAKLVFSGNPSKENCIYMSFGYRSFSFATWTPELKDWRQCSLKKRTDDELIDLIYFNDCFYFLTMKYNIWVLDTADVYSTLEREGDNKELDTRFYEVEISSDIPRQNDNDVRIYRYLVELGEDILLIVRFLSDSLDETDDFNIFRLDFDRKKWVNLDSLGSYVLFLGWNCSRCYPANELGVDGDCIHFTNGSDALGLVDRESIDYSAGEMDSWGVFMVLGDKPDDSSYHTKRPPIWLSAPLWWYCNKFRH